MRRLALLAVVSVLATACTMTSSGKRTLVAGGLMTAGAGVVLVAAGAEVVDANGNGHNGTALDDDYTTPVLGAFAITAGLVMALAALAIEEADEAPVRARPPWQPYPAPLAAPPPGTQLPVGTALPELPVDPETLRLAKQTRLVINAGHCDAARPLLADIQMRSTEYYWALVAGPVTDPCPGLRDLR